MPLDWELFNQRYTPLRVCVEWGYMKVVQLWSFVDYKKQMRIEGVAVEADWVVAVWLTNIHTCIRKGNIISAYFDLEPPSIDEYLHTTMEL